MIPGLMLKFLSLRKATWGATSKNNHLRQKIADWNGGNVKDTDTNNPPKWPIGTEIQPEWLLPDSLSLGCIYW